MVERAQPVVGVVYATIQHVGTGRIEDGAVKRGQAAASETGGRDVGRDASPERFIVLFNLIFNRSGSPGESGLTVLTALGGGVVRGDPGHPTRSYE